MSVLGRRLVQYLARALVESWSGELNQLLYIGRVSGVTCGTGITTCLERLGVPVFNFFDRRHVAKLVRQLIELSDAVCKSHREFLCECGGHT
jgi:hypothetical protein